MKLVGLMLARNEDWVIGLSARVALLWCDAIVVLLHNCTDTTAEILETIRWESELGRVIRRTCSSDHWEEMALRQTMLEIARGMDATHLAMIDADEVLTGDLLPTIRKHVDQLGPGEILQVPQLCTRETISGPVVISSGMWARQNTPIAFGDSHLYHWAARDGYDHHQRNPLGIPYQPKMIHDDRSKGVMHLQFSSYRRLLAKQFLYQLTDRRRWPNQSTDLIRNRYAPTVNEACSGEVELVPGSWWAPYSHLLKYLHVDREPWQESECKRLLEQDPKLTAGLDDFGLMTEWGMEVAR